MALPFEIRLLHVSKPPFSPSTSIYFTHAHYIFASSSLSLYIYSLFPFSCKLILLLSSIKVHNKKGKRVIAQGFNSLTMRTSCFLSLPPLTSNQPSNAKPPQSLLSPAKKESCWKRQCVVMGIIGLEMCNSVALAHEAIQITIIPTANHISNTNSKWSQKRTCPPWQGNSLETIVPENLPRPSARRRYQTIRSSSKTAPSLSPPIVLQTNNTTCFFM